MLAALGAGLADGNSLADGWVRLVERARPDATRAARYAHLYEQYVASYPALRPVMHALRSEVDDVVADLRAGR
jgi:xylulokinase